MNAIVSYHFICTPSGEVRDIRNAFSFLMGMEISYYIFGCKKDSYGRRLQMLFTLFYHRLMLHMHILPFRMSAAMQ